MPGKVDLMLRAGGFNPGVGHGSGEPHCQLPVGTEVAVDECLYR